MKLFRRPAMKLWAVGLLAAVTVGTDSLPSTAQPPPPSNPGRLALLVGCTQYPNLRSSKQLKGPTNDLHLLRKVLTAKPYNFPPETIRSLSEAPDDHGPPTLENIRRGFAWLVEQAKPDDQIVVLLAGHGSRQPANADPNGDDPEPDGKDEVFLPRDIGKWAPQNQCIENALVDDEIFAFAQQVIGKGAHLWIILDSCHSGAGIRGDDEQVAREVLPDDLGIPHGDDVAVNRGSLTEAPFDLRPSKAGKTGNLIAFYAAQSGECEYEVPLPPNDPQALKYGLLTYALCQQLQQSRTSAATYAELGRGIYQQYQAWGRWYPTPFVDGLNLQAPVLGQPAGFQLEIQLTRGDEEGYRINAGRIHGITAGSQLAVYAVDTDLRKDRPVGHIQVVMASLDEAEVKPCAYRDAAERSDLPDGGDCHVVFQNLGDARLRLAVDHRSPLATEELAKSLKTLDEDLRRGESDPRSPFVVVDSLSSAQWVVQPRGDDLKLVSSDVALVEKDAELPRGTTLISLRGDRPVDIIQRELGRIFRAQNLIALAGQTLETPRGDSGLRLKLEMLKYRNKTDTQGTPIDDVSRGVRLQENEYVAWQVTNEDEIPVDISLLYVASDWKILSVFPQAQSVGVNNRLTPGQQYATRPIRVTTSTVGREHLVLIALEAAGPQRDFRVLAESNLAAAQSRELTTRGEKADVFKTPLGRLLKASLYREGLANGVTTRGPESDGLDGKRSGIVSMTWDVLTREP